MIVKSNFLCIIKVVDIELCSVSTFLAKVELLATICPSDYFTSAFYRDEEVPENYSHRSLLTTAVVSNAFPIHGLYIERKYWTGLKDNSPPVARPNKRCSEWLAFCDLLSDANIS